MKTNNSKTKTNFLSFTLKVWFITGLLAPTFNWCMIYSQNIVDNVSNAYLQNLPETILIQSVITIPICILSIVINRILFQKLKNEYLLKQYLCITSGLLIGIPWVIVCIFSGDLNILFILGSYITVLLIVIWSFKINNGQYRMVYPNILDDDLHKESFIHKPFPTFFNIFIKK